MAIQAIGTPPCHLLSLYLFWSTVFYFILFFCYFPALNLASWKRESSRIYFIIPSNRWLDLSGTFGAELCVLSVVTISHQSEKWTDMLIIGYFWRLIYDRHRANVTAQTKWSEPSSTLYYV
jgi:hypothetical protein